MKVDVYLVILANAACLLIGYWRGWRHRTWLYQDAEKEYRCDYDCSVYREEA